jgi:hypothetical protein
MPLSNPPLGFQCEVTPVDQGYAAIGTFHILLPVDAQRNELDQIECSVKHAGRRR